MHKINFTFLFLIALSAVAITQNDIDNSFIDPSQLEPTQHYDWVNNFNEKNHDNRLHYKNDKTHQLDSSISYVANYDGPNPGSFNFLKLLHFYEDSRDIQCSYDRVNFRWEPDNLTIEHYNDENLITSRSFNSWNGDLTNFEDSDPLILRSYFYDENNLLIEQHIQNQSEVRNKILGNVENYYYNIDGLLKSIDFSFWSVPRDSLVLNASLSYTYDTMQNLVLTKRYDNDNDRGYYATDSILCVYDNEGFLQKKNYI